MKIRLRYVLMLVLLLILQNYALRAQENNNFSTQNNVQRMEWTVDSITREALVYIPASAKEKITPLVFAFHGRGGKMLNSKNQYNFHNLWSDAIVVYPQGLVNGGFKMMGGKHAPSTRWQVNPGDDDDRDLKFFDIMLDYFNKNYNVNVRGGVYLTGHSNGGGFVFLLWAERADAFAAVAPTAAAISTHSSNAAILDSIKSRPVFILAGLADELVPYTRASEVIQRILELNKCTSNSTVVSPYLTLYESEVNKRTMTYIHPGRHALPQGVNALIIDFFKNIDKHTCN